MQHKSALRKGAYWIKRHLIYVMVYRDLGGAVVSTPWGHLILSWKKKGGILMNGKRWMLVR